MEDDSYDEEQYDEFGNYIGPASANADANDVADIGV